MWQITFMMEHVTELLKTKNYRPLAITLCECSLYCQGYYCLHPYCIACSQNEVATNQKHEPCELAMWGQQQLRQTTGPLTSTQ